MLEGTHPELGYPADMYLEGSDQHRGWFQSSLLEAAGYKSEPPFRQVLTHGFVVDEKGRKMAKSEGNDIKVAEASSIGQDILRLWVASVDYQNDIPCGWTSAWIRQARRIGRFGIPYDTFWATSTIMTQWPTTRTQAAAFHQYLDDPIECWNGVPKSTMHTRRMSFTRYSNSSTSSVTLKSSAFLTPKPSRIACICELPNITQAPAPASVCVCTRSSTC